MIKVFDLFKKYILEKLPQITFISLTVVFFVNAFLNIGLLADGTWDFLNILNDICWTSENRNYATFIINFPMILAIKLGSTDFNLFIVMQGFWFFFVTLTCLFISYINVPKGYKNLFHFVLLSYLISMNFISTFITTESFICAGLYWIIAIIFIFENFNKISLKKIFLLIICSFAMIKNYQWSAIFVLPLILYWFIKIKEINFDNIKINKVFNVFLLTIVLYMFILTLKWVYINYSNCKHLTANPIYTFYTDPKFVSFLITTMFTMIILIGAFLKSNKLFKIFLYISFFCIPCLILKYNFLYSIGNFRLVNFITPLLFSFLIFYIYKKNIFVNYTIIKILNLFLLITFIINISIISQKWNHELESFYKHIMNTQSIIAADTKPLRLQEGYYHLYPWLSIILQKQKGYSNINSIGYINDPKQKAYDYPGFNIAISTESLPNLTKFNIIYSDELLKKIEENSKLHSKINEKNY